MIIAMKRFLKSFLLVLAISVFAMSCTKDGGGSYSKRIVGTWRFKTVTYYYDDNTVETESAKDLEQDGVDINDVSYVFRADGKVHTIKYPAFVQSWSIKGNKLSFALYEVTIISLDSKQMVWDVSDLYNNLGSSFNEAFGSQTMEYYDKVIITYERRD